MARQYFNTALSELRDQIITMGSYVAEELRFALAALEELDTEKARHVKALDKQVNEIRFAIEESCFTLIATQQPAAGDLRMVFAAANMIVDLERMGDQTKGVAKLIPDLSRHPELPRPVELKQMGEMVGEMLQDALRAYAESDTQLAETVSERDQQVDALYAQLYTEIMFMLAKNSDPERSSQIYSLLRCAREFERFGDLAVNFAERSIYMVTGEMPGDHAQPQIPGFGLKS